MRETNNFLLLKCSNEHEVLQEGWAGGPKWDLAEASRRKSSQAWRRPRAWGCNDACCLSTSSVFLTPKWLKASCL